LFEREGDDVDGARYKVAIYTPTATFAGAARLGYDGSARVEVAEAPAELVASAEMFGKLTARAALKQKDDGMPPWPARILRWRGPGRGQ